ncbi:MAG: GH116 family glycosyl hydrolase [Armatimonadetes bacterium]|nr:GH116 family glycosyl hydrolase [Armatimonadota bacterium]
MKGGISRREFVKTIAVTATIGAAGYSMTSVEPVQGEQTVIGANPPMNSGIPMGGIGAGTVELRADGTFYEWQIFNDWASKLRLEDSLFAVWVNTGVETLSRLLQLNSRGLAQGVSEIGYVGEHPFAMLDYADPNLPVNIHLDAWTPFIPLNEKDSALPCAIFTFNVHNPNSNPVDVSIMASQRNGAGYDLNFRGTRNRKGATSKGIRVSMEALSGGKPPSMSKPIRLLLVSDRVHGGFASAFDGVSGLKVTWATGEGSNAIRLPADNGQELARRFDCVWVGEITHARDMLGDADMKILQEAVNAGMGLIYSGGWDAFYGYSSDRWGHMNGSILEGILPVNFLNRFDAVNQATSISKVKNELAQQVFSNLTLPSINGYNLIAGVKPGGTVIANGFAGQPLVIAGHYGKGRTLVYASSVWGGWPPTLDRVDSFYRTMVAYVSRSSYLQPDHMPATWQSFGLMTLTGLGRGAYRVAWNDFEDIWTDFNQDGKLEPEGTLDSSSYVRNAAVTQRLHLEPNKGGKVTFVLTWHFPNHLDADRNQIGHMYSNWFEDADEVADYVIASLPDLRRKTDRFRREFYSARVERKILDAINAQLTTMSKDSWWDKDGKFGVWEGEGCCGLQTTDVSYYGSNMITVLFPKLERSEIHITVDHQAPNGDIPHFFPATFDHPDGYYRIDMMSQYVLMAYRDWQWIGDRQFLQFHWPHVVAALDDMNRRDTDGDGLPNDTGADQTYDGWPMYGTSVYVSSLYLTALRAAVQMGKALGQTAQADIFSQRYHKAQPNFQKELWNGQYYDLYYDPKTGKRDHASLAAATDAVWYASLHPGLGSPYPKERLLSTLNTIYTRNRQNGSIINGWWPNPAEAMPRGGQWSAVWSGVEYALASNMIYNGMVEQGLQVVREVQDRYLKMGRPWNHFECGNHYFRPMSIWTVLMAIQGFHYSAPEGWIAFSPRVAPTDHRSVFTTPVCWGIIMQSSAAQTIELVEGELPLRSVKAGLGHTGVRYRVLVNGKIVSVVASRAGEWTSLQFPEPMILRVGDRLTIRWG